MQKDQGSNRYKLNARDIKCNFLIGSDGKVYVGRGWNYQVETRRSFPQICYEICLIGDFSGRRTHPNPKAITSLDALITLGQPYNIAPNYKVYSHFDVACAICPGVNLRALMKYRPNYGGPQVRCRPRTRGNRHAVK
jgi:hypothetical protein